MKTLAKLMALCMLLGTLGFAQAADSDKKGDDASMKKSDTATKKAKKGKAKGKKKAAKKGAAEDKGMDKGMDKK
jgi:hypothetical protein